MNHAPPIITIMLYLGFAALAMLTVAYTAMALSDINRCLRRRSRRHHQ